MKRTLVENGTVVTPGGVVQGDVFVEGRRIVEVGPGLAKRLGGLEDAEKISAEGKIVLPGAIDAHTHMDMPFGGFFSADDFFSGTVAAALGGTTTIVDYAESAPSGLRDGFAAWMEKAVDRAVVDYSFHMTLKECNPQILREMSLMMKLGVTSFKVFTAYPGRMMLNDEDILRVMKRAAELNAVVVVHAEDGLLIDDMTRRTRRAKALDPIDHALTRPSAGECRAVCRVVKMAESTGATVVIAHISAHQAAEIVRDARRRGIRVYGETCPQYLWLEQEKLKSPGLQGAAFICAPPLRDVTHMNMLWKGLSEGWIDILGTDHCPFNLEGEKDLGLLSGGGFDFTRVPGGLPGVQTRLLLAYAGGVLAGRFDLVRLAEITATIPAKVFGLAPEKGGLIPGADADIVILDPNGVTSLDADDLASDVDYSPYEGMRVEGVIDTVMSRGECIVIEERFVGEKGRGEFIPRRPFSQDSHNPSRT